MDDGHLAKVLSNEAPFLLHGKVRRASRGMQIRKIDTSKKMEKDKILTILTGLAACKGFSHWKLGGLAPNRSLPSIMRSNVSNVFQCIKIQIVIQRQAASVVALMPTLLLYDPRSLATISLGKASNLEGWTTRAGIQKQGMT